MSGLVRNFLFAVGRGVREFGQMVDMLGCTIQGNYAFKEQLNLHRRVMHFDKNIPKLGDDIFIAPNASVIGKVQLDKSATVWYGSVLRGDVNTIKVGSKSSIGDNSIIHVSSSLGDDFNNLNSVQGQSDGSGVEIGNNVVIESGVTIHGCTVKDNAKIGMGSTVLDKAIIKEGAIVGPGSMVLSGVTVPSGQYWAGSPAKFVRDVTEEENKSVKEALDDLYKLAKQHEQEQAKSALDKMLEKERKDLYLPMGLDTEKY
eukprot:TRINITY_DN249_c0_g2_i1.p1 TRINITY_DN249_c0_g2~~TRINITY_DN249_c0_g2_i1.p1  ORF type:complete len:258 (-),score=112.92 TRINITY_DN249_c0_g2_i1:109-882(-)